MIRVSVEENCPSNDFIPAKPSGDCWGDGHYKCEECIFFRADFKADPTLRERLLQGQAGIHFYAMGQGHKLVRFA